jgi:hypothetical protein
MMSLTAVVTSAIVGVAIVAATALNPTGAGADELNDLRADQAQINARIDQLAKPSNPQTPDQPTLDSPAPNGATPGSFPRSFLIPGTNTSIRVGGFLDETGQSR